VSAWLGVKVFMRFVENHGLKAFGYYRIFIGIVFLAYIMLSGSASLFNPF
jgi:undecaprenyl-diphosphatase